MWGVEFAHDKTNYEYKKREKLAEINFASNLPRWALVSCEECRQTAGSSVHPSSALKSDQVTSHLKTGHFAINCL